MARALHGRLCTVRRTEPTPRPGPRGQAGSVSYDTFTPVMARPGKEGLSKVAGVIDGVLAKPAASAVASHPPALGPLVTGDEGATRRGLSGVSLKADPAIGSAG